MKEKVSEEDQANNASEEEVKNKTDKKNPKDDSGDPPELGSADK